MKYLILLSFVFFACCQTGPKHVNYESNISCIGDGNSEYGAIYLHGIDSINLSTQEKNNRDILQLVSKKFKLKIALPRASKFCNQSNDQICWGWAFDQIEMNEIQNKIETSSKACKLPSKNILIGYSNGGYALNKLFRLCYLNENQTIISSGANYLRGPLEYNTPDLSICGRLIFISGKNDQYNYDNTNSYSEKLKEKSADVNVIEFEGGHEITLDSLSSAITTALKNIK